MFVELGGETLLLARRGAAADGEISVHRWNGAWSVDERPIISGESQTWTAGPYLNSPVVYRDGRGVGLFLVWRLTGGATSAGRVVNVGVDFTQTLDGFRSLQTIAGVKQSLPMTPMTSERVVAVPIGASLINQASAAVRSDGSPAFVTYWGDGDDPIQYRLGWRQGANWRVKKISRFRTKFSLQGDGTLPLPHSRPELLFDAHDNAIALYRSRERGNALMATLLSAPGYDLASARECVLAADDLGFYEPIVNRQAWARDFTLGLYVQRCNQGFAEDGKRTLSSAPARYLEWRYSDLLQASRPLAR